MLAAIAIEDLTMRYSQTPEIGIAYVYCNFRRRDEQTTDQLLANVLKQLSWQKRSLSAELRELWNRHKEKQTRLSLDDVLKILHLTVSSFSSVFIVIDAVDECQRSDGCRTALLTEIRRIQQSFKINVLATSRFIPEIVDHFRSIDSVSLEVSASREDVERYIDGNMTRMPSFVQRNLKLQVDIKTSISESVDGMCVFNQYRLRAININPA